MGSEVGGESPPFPANRLARVCSVQCSLVESGERLIRKFYDVKGVAISKIGDTGHCHIPFC